MPPITASFIRGPRFIIYAGVRRAIIVRRLWLAGPPGSGKSTVADWIAKKFDADVLHIGDQLRAKHGTGAFVGLGDHAHAPACFDAEVEAIITEGIRNQDPDRTLVIDSCPRVERQCRFIPQWNERRQVLQGVPMDLVGLVRASKGVRDSRIRERDAGSQELAKQAGDGFEATYASVLRSLVKNRVPLAMLSNEELLA